MNEIVNVSLDYLIHHPGNPRKEIGDIEELIESVKTQGVMQNLTIIPINYWDSEVSEVQEDEIKDKISDVMLGLSQMETQILFYILIGNRRFEAAKAAGLESVPCRIVTNMSKDEQVGLMLLENIQRADLTVPEQARGFQMMIDLGATVESLSADTGFSPATIYHRLNIAKLDEELVDVAIMNHQLTLSEFAELEKVEDIEKRNHILKTYPGNIKFGVSRAIEEKNTKEWQRDVFSKIRKEHLLEEKPDSIKTWDDGVKMIASLDVGDEVDISVFPDARIYYTISWRGLGFYYVDEEKQKEIKAKKDIETAEQKQREEKIKALRDDEEKIKTEIERYVRYLMKEPTVFDGKDAMESIWQGMMNCEYGFSVDTDDICAYMEDEPEDELEDEEAKTRLAKIPVPVQMLVTLYDTLRYGDFHMYGGRYDEEKMNEIDRLVSIMKDYFGFEWDEKTEEVYESLVNGTHSGYAR
ncbi:MAG: ParB N-terminal domain-containing protein [Eubacterium sp.]|nr:ParB N-terminal domain-containing protein [Eubacterium sp.]